MDIKEFYKSIETDPGIVLQRLRNETLIKKYLLKFVEDTNFAELKQAIEENDPEKAFRAAHTMKGICLNLELGKLTAASVELTESLRNFDGDKALLKEKLDNFENCYRDIVRKIADIQ